MEAAVKLPGQPVRRGSMAHDHDVYVLLADAAAQHHDAGGLRQYAPRAGELAERDAHKLYLGVAQRARGVAARLEGGYEAAEVLLRQALEVFQQMGTRWQAGRTWAELGELALARSNPGAARDNFAQALAAFEAMQATPDAARTRARLDSIVWPTLG
jgi:hypothetical protein